jgi:hypothetical protein
LLPFRFSSGSGYNFVTIHHAVGYFNQKGRAMKLIGFAALLTAICFGQAVGQISSQIKDTIFFGNGSGLVWTSTSIYKTGDDGSTWSEMSLEKMPTQSIAWVDISADGRGFVLLADEAGRSLEIKITGDGGLSFNSHPVAIAAKMLDGLDIENAWATDHDEWTIFIPVETSSNFRSTAFFRSVDLRTWKQTMRANRRWEQLGTISAESKHGDWTLKQSGQCFGLKSACFQETRLYSGEREITPPQVAAELDVARQSAAAEANATPRFQLAPGGTTRVSLGRGFDQCNAPTVAQMQAWWTSSPHYNANIYFSGRNRACSTQPNLNASWVDQVTQMGWGLIPTVVGYQSPCTASATTAKLSYDVATAEQQGRGEADIAAAAAVNIGLAPGSIFYYDMERYDPPSPDTLGCRAATVAFLKGWTDRVKELGYKSGVYGSPKNAQEDWVNLPSASKMDVIWMARWDNVPSVWSYVSFPSFPTDEWTDHQRIKQWQAPHNETWGGVTINIDGNILDAPIAGIAVAKNKAADFDGDGKTDISVYRPDTGVWYVATSSNGGFTATQFGLATDILAPGDYDGDGKTDQAVFRPSEGTWHILTKAGVYTTRQWGTTGDIPAPGDYNGDGYTDLAVFRPSNGVWYIANSDSQGTITYAQFGTAGDKPAQADYDGDGKTDIAVYRLNNGSQEWWIQRSTAGLLATVFGAEGDQAAQGDFTGDGKADIAVWRPSNGFWFILRSEDLSYLAFPFGQAGDIPSPGDFDGDGKWDSAVFRPSTGVWYVQLSSGGFNIVQFGQSGDRSVPQAYQAQ